MWGVVIGVILILMKWLAFGPVATLSWWWVLAPFAGAALWWAYADSTGYYQRKAMEKMDERRRERRVKNLQALGLQERKRKR